jgi:hypothetical protein
LFSTLYCWSSKVGVRLATVKRTNCRRATYGPLVDTRGEADQERTASC